jgi:hypothetical protein
MRCRPTQNTKSAAHVVDATRALLIPPDIPLPTHCVFVLASDERQIPCSIRFAALDNDATRSRTTS